MLGLYFSFNRILSTICYAFVAISSGRVLVGVIAVIFLWLLHYIAASSLSIIEFGIKVFGRQVQAQPRKLRSGQIHSQGMHKVGTIFRGRGARVSLRPSGVRSVDLTGNFPTNFYALISR